VDTDLVPALDARAGDLVQNPTEAKLVRQVSVTSRRDGLQRGMYSGDVYGSVC
jgi:hypothetical protein